MDGVGRFRRPVRFDMEGPPSVDVRRPFRGVDDNNLGQSIDVAYGEVSRVLLDARGLDSGSECLTCYVTYDVLTNPNTGQLRLPTDDMTNLRLRIEFGVGGTSQSVEVDFLRGLFFSVPATSLRIIVDYPSTDGKTGPDIRAHGILGYGSKSNSGAHTQPRLTVPLGSVSASTESVVVEIPTLATAVSIHSSADSDLAGCWVRQRLSPHAVGNVISARHAGDDVIPLVGGAQGLSVFNGSARATDFYAVFALAL